MKSIRDKKSWTDAYKSAADSYADLKVLVDFYQAGEGTEEELDRHYKESLKHIEDLEFRKCWAERKTSSA
jgi:peptide chain release factor 2